MAAERFSLGCPLNLQQASVAGDDDIEIHFGPAVLAVVQVQQRDAVHQANRDRRKLVADRVCTDQPTRFHCVTGLTQCQPGSCHGGCTRPGISLNHVTVNQQSSLTEGFHIEHGSQAATDQPLNLLGAARQFHQLTTLPLGC